MVAGLEMTKETKDSGKKGEKTSLPNRLLMEELEREFSSSSGAFFSGFDRLSVQDMSELRRSLEKVSRRTLVVKHSLARKIFEKIHCAEAAHFLKGSVLVTFGKEEPQVVSKTLVDFIKGRETVEVKGMILEGKVYEGNFVKELAKLPSREQLLTLLAIRLKSPIYGFTLTLAGLLRSLITVLNEVQKKKASPTA